MLDTLFKNCDSYTHVYLQNGPSVVSGLSTQELLPANTSEGFVSGVYGLSDLCDLLIGEVCRSNIISCCPTCQGEWTTYLVNHYAVATDQVELLFSLPPARQSLPPFE